MKKFVPLYLFMTTISSINAQYYDAKTMSIAAGSNLINKEILDWSLGEAIAIYTWTDSNQYLLSSGFLQNKNDDRALYASHRAFGEQIKVGPIPTIGLLKINAKETGITIKGVQLFNELGMLIIEKKGVYAGHNYAQEIKINNLQNGFYYLIVHYIIADLLIEYKIIKIIKQ